MSLVIRTATHEDIDLMFTITCAVHQTSLYKKLIPRDSYPRFIDRYQPSTQRHEAFAQKISSRLADKRWYLWVAEVDGEVCGFTLAYDTGEVLELRGLFVDEAHQGQGIGRRLFEASCEAARPAQTISLDVLEANERAIDIYERAGFHTVADVPPTYYGAKMIRMQKH